MRIIVLAIAVVMVFGAMSTAFAYTPATVRNGSNGNHVLLLQWTMHSTLSGVSLSTVDGVAGSVTASNIRRFQSIHSLTSDGVAGGGTWGKITSSHFFRYPSGVPSTPMIDNCGISGCGGTRTFSSYGTNATNYLTKYRTNSLGPNLIVPNA